jgi:transposase
VVELLPSSGRPLSQIAQELGIPAARLRAWRSSSGGGQAGSPRGPNTQAAIPHAGTDLAAENTRLQRENERLRMEREILKNQRGPRFRLWAEKRLALPWRRRGAAVRFLVAYDPVKKHGPRAGADLRVVTLSWRSRLGK